ncbi:MAG: three-Cys-motif partner protein TcmP [Candidatus Eisenbacteria bacterium]|uniref:Three-Cys-motif partner protein TcmP n=1 Tax=Eiseniibacteriota bacterium TaxID=2212470 RepID=A0A948RXB4_UNCEI|nr:three-Cys-motif partner protein TcmP [Candidatus Eisenbacteria bacterium]MBU2690762.1 three-Cys-motif partner protein TcmP [Candidatus Eisenbacteria bacterium]
MAAPKETIWNLDPHTKAKHDILCNYLQAWFPILSTWHGRIIYYDGFAGPGRYKGGEIGSPLIALNVAKTHQGKLARDLVFVFVESDKRRAKHLESEIVALKPPKRFHCYIENKDFETALRETLDSIQEKGLQIAPTFAFVDPFGIKGLPFELIERLLSNPHCEVLITFMNVTLRRFADVIPKRINELLGHSDAADRLSALHTAKERVILARQLYAKSLERQARFVRYFAMRDKKDQELYDLFFATNHSKGHEKMKTAMWRLDETGNYSFSDGVDPDQATLFTSTPERDFAPILWERFRGQTVYSDEVLQYTWDKTAFLDKHAKGALRLLEAEEGFKGHSIEVDSKKADGDPRRRNTYPKGVRITFEDKES